MLKVFLVEDEIVVREGIKNNISWEENGFRFCGEASDGELAYPMIQNVRPDIVITDIRMPFMDGLELGRLIKGEMPGTKIIILSGYGEFEYAKEAINIGVTEYLLKPISSVELMNCMKTVRDNIRKEQEEKANLEKFIQDMKENEEDEKRRLFNDIVNNTQSLSCILERGKELNLELSALVYNIIRIKINLPKQLKNSADKIQQELNALLERKDNLIRFDCFPEGMALLLKGNNVEELLHSQQYYIEQIKHILDSENSSSTEDKIASQKENRITYFGGIGMPVNRLGELPFSYHEASRAFAYRYIWDLNEILDYTTIAKEQMESGRPSGLDMGNVIKLDRRKVSEFLKTGSRDETTYFVEEYLKSIGKENRNSLLFRQYMIMDMYYIVAGYIEEMGNEVEEIEEPFKDQSQINLLISSFDYTQNYIVTIFRRAIELREEINTRQYNDIIDKAKQYINENYQKEELSLNLVASSVYISPNHLSAVFSQKTGQTFIKYLTDLRMNKAKELLRSTDMRTSDIGYAVGYKDPHYFSYLFKKTQNCTPKQYRFHNTQ